MNDDLISRKAVLGLPRSITRNFFGEIVEESINVKEIEALPSAQPEPTLEQIEEYCHKRCLSIVDNALLHKYAQAEIIRCKDCNYACIDPERESDEIYCNDDLISRAEAVEKAKECFDMGDCYCDKPAIIGMLNSLTSAQPELIAKAAYIRGFEQGRTQGMIDTKAEEVAQTNLQPTCNQLATDVISRKAALDGIDDYLEEYDGIDENGNHDLKWCAMKEAELLIKDLPSAQPATSCSEFPNTSDVVSRKAVREMVSTWAYDLMEQEDLNMALHDVDELPTAQPEVIYCKDCKHRDPEDKKCDSGHAIQWQLPRSDDWFCADAERKQK